MPLRVLNHVLEILLAHQKTEGLPLRLMNHSG
jgi:hypothetical protein